MSALADVRPRVNIRHEIAWRRLLPVGVLIFILFAVAFLGLPRSQNSALAAVAEAMAQVKNAHFVGWDPSGSGGRDHIEGWVDSKRGRSIEGDVMDEYYDENRLITINSVNGSQRVTISPLPPEMAKLLQARGGYLRTFLWPQAAQDALERRGEIVSTQKTQRLPGGQSVLVFDLIAGNTMTRMTVDEATDLILRIEHYRNGEMVGAIEKIEYNVNIPDSIFTAVIPKAAIVIDRSNAPGKHQQPTAKQRSQMARWLAEAKQIPGACLLSQITPGYGGGGCGTPFHKNLRFEYFENEGLLLVYLPDQNVYRVFGKALVYENGGAQEPGPIVRNGEYVPLNPPDVTIEEYQARQRQEADAMQQAMPSTKVLAEWEAKGKELKAAGAYCLLGLGTFGHYKYTFDMANGKYIRVWYSPARREFFIMGKARIHGPGFDSIIEDNWIKVPGPAPKLPDETAH
jgi:hypothetical protein